ncbi:hypothetical protein F383_15037 [Gossypium arboreum]|uniref:Uncharacterized protein n=1 Tax=Gossypium arboreum TaxID=29729 RepID=A0A0B0MN84_GOSAR|nr:hypothetical protein F383_20455 [Gossypium arboreum]KHG09316.1 hypothetical protein F383_15037 [Gossypium arboreum]
MWYVGANVEERDVGRPTNMRRWSKGRAASLFSVLGFSLG